MYEGERLSAFQPGLRLNFIQAKLLETLFQLAKNIRSSRF